MGALAAWKAMPRTLESTGRERAVGTHFPMLAAAIAVAALAFAARITVRFKPGLPEDFHPERDAEPLTRFADRRSGVVTTTNGNLGFPTLAHSSGRSTRSAGLGLGSTRTPSAGRPGCSIKQLG
jgi:hypothetical protein